MSTRCKGCNRKLFDSEISQFKNENEYEDLCGVCRSASYSQYDYINDHEYTQGHLSSSFDGGLTPPMNSQE